MNTNEAFLFTKPDFSSASWRIMEFKLVPDETDSIQQRYWIIAHHPMLNINTHLVCCRTFEIGMFMLEGIAAARSLYMLQHTGTPANG